jgi:multiple sugar transport system ATP-binding protein
MANIKLEKLTRSFGKQVAVKDLSLDIGENEFIALLGPSGCGKTTTMNMISGLLKPDSGQVYFDGKLMNDVPPGRRGVGFVFQNYAVFTHMTAHDNIACGLKVRNVPKQEINRTVNEFANLLKIDHILHLSAGKLSINDMQKVALARTMVTKPNIMLLDEPLSNLDAALRNVMRAELKKIHLELGQTTVYVTHDQVEAMSLADKIAVMNFAILQQYDTPEEVYLRPKNLFVANFIGSPTINFFKGSYRGNEIILKEFPKGKIKISGKHINTLNNKLKHENVVVGLRPEHIKLKERDKNRQEGIKAQIVGIEPLGSETIVYLKPKAGEDLIVKSMMDSDYSAHINDTKLLSFHEDDIYIFDEETTQLVLKF